MTQTVFIEFIERAREPNPAQQVQYVRDAVLGIHLNEEDDDKDDTNEINDAQSTHRTSVHQNISESTKKLLVDMAVS